MIDRLRDALDARLGEHLSLEGPEREVLLTEVLADILQELREPSDGMKKACYRAVGKDRIEGTPMAVKRIKCLLRWKAMINHLARSGGIYLR